MPRAPPRIWSGLLPVGNRSLQDRYIELAVRTVKSLRFESSGVADCTEDVVARILGGAFRTSLAGRVRHTNDEIFLACYSMVHVPGTIINLDLDLLHVDLVGLEIYIQI